MESSNNSRQLISSEARSQSLEAEEIDETIFGNNNEEDSDQDIKDLSKSLIKNDKPNQLNNKTQKNDYNKMLPDNIDDLDEKDIEQQDEDDKINQKDKHKNKKDKNQSMISQLSVHNTSFAKIKKNQIRINKIVAPQIKNYTFTMSINDVLIQIIETDPEPMHNTFDCIVLPYSDIPLNIPPFSKMLLKKKTNEKDIFVQSTLIEETKKGKIGISDTLFLNDTWFKRGNYWKAGITIRVPRYGDYDDKLLLFKSIGQILKTFEINSQSKQELQSMVIPWLVDESFNVQQAAEIMIQGLFKSIKDLKDKKIKRIAICSRNPNQIKELKSNLRKKIFMLLTK